MGAVTMIQRALGRSDINLHPVGLGCMQMSEFYGGAEDKRASTKVIHRALEEGCRLLDTADMYGLGRNETLVGEAIRDRREQVILATKFGIVRSESGEFAGLNGRPDYVKKACEASLRRLQVDFIDLYYQHRVDPQVPIEDTVGAMSDLVKEGKVRYLGLSEVGSLTLKRAHEVHPLTAVQNELSLWTRDYETEVVPLCESLGISFVAYSPLGRGFLTGVMSSRDELDDDDWRRNNPRFSEGAFERNFKVVKKLNTWASERGFSPAQLALAWVLSRGSQVFAIPGTRRISRLLENLQAALVKLRPQDLHELDQLVPVGTFEGRRYPEAMMALLNA